MPRRRRRHLPHHVLPPDFIIRHDLIHHLYAGPVFTLTPPHPCWAPLTEKARAFLAPLIPGTAQRGPGHPMADARARMDAVLRLVTLKRDGDGLAPWRAPPPGLGKPDTASRAVGRWAAAGPWERLLHLVASLRPGGGRGRRAEAHVTVPPGPRRRIRLAWRRASRRLGPRGTAPPATSAAPPPCARPPPPCRIRICPRSPSCPLSPARWTASWRGRTATSPAAAGMAAGARRSAHGARPAPCRRWPAAARGSPAPWTRREQPRRRAPRAAAARAAGRIRAAAHLRRAAVRADPRRAGPRRIARPRPAWHGRARMLSVPASRPNAYTGSPLDRAANLREDADFVARALADEETLFAPVWRARSLMRGVEDGAPEAVLLTGAAAQSVRMAGGPWSFLGLWEGRPVFAVDCSAAADPLPLLPDGMGAFTDLRAVAGLLPPGEASVLAHARGLMHWRTKHVYCGACGGACEPRSAGHVMACPGCRLQHFPRTDPAVIMLVVRGDRCLLGHSTRFPSSAMYSTLAGFVEPGESLEEAVRREVAEETGVEVGAVWYHSSQPWPFPSSIMLGFHAEGLTDEITIDAEELRDARWFSREELADPKAHGFALPRADSIARRLIEDWLAQEGGGVA